MLKINPYYWELISNNFVHMSDLKLNKFHLQGAINIKYEFPENVIKIYG